MKRVAAIVVVLLVIVASASVGAWFDRRWIVEIHKAEVEELNARIARANENAQGFANQYANHTTGGATDDWFEKNAMTRYGQPEDLLRMADDIGLKHIRKTRVVYVDGNDQSTVHGVYSDGLHGDPDGRAIQIAKGLSDAEKRTTLAHEYLHYIWLNSAALQNDIKLEQRLLYMYDATPGLRDRMLPYQSRGMVSRTEIFSISCTEVSDAHIDNYVKQQCDKWIRRAGLVMRY